MKYRIQQLFIALLLIGIYANTYGQKLSFEKGSYYLDGRETDLDALESRLNPDLHLQMAFDRLKKWEHFRRTSGQLFLVSAFTAGLSMASIHYVFSSDAPILLQAVLFGPLLGIALLSVPTATFSLLTWTVASIKCPNLRTDFLHHYNSAVPTGLQGIQLEFGLTSGGVGLSLRF
jgi:hypothetical protein